MMYAIILSVIAATLGLYYFWFKNMSRFKKHGIPHEKPLPFIGNMRPWVFRRQSLAQLTTCHYNMNPDAKYVGMYDMTEPIVVLRDPELIKLVMLKHFDSFTDHRLLVDQAHDKLFSQNLFCLCGEKWREARILLSPFFTSSKMKNMFKLMFDYSATFSNYLAEMPPEKRTMEMKDIFTKYTNDIIASCAFGIGVNSIRDPDNEFYAYSKEALNFTKNLFGKSVIFNNLPWLARILRLKFVHEKLENFFHNLIETTVKIRDERDIVRPDMLQLMMESRNDDSKPNLTIDEMVAHAFLFFLGGFDSVASLMCFTAYEIAMKPDILETLQKEIDDVLEETNGQVTYEAINNMEYLDAVFHETLRKYPGIAVLDRSCVKDFELPPTLPGTKPFIIKKGEGIWIPVYSLQHDAKYFENPEEFDPERFLGERKKKILNGGTYFPFGLGPRMCIGNRFALLETKVLFFNLLARCDLKPNGKTTKSPKFAKYSVILMLENDILLDVIPRKNIHRTIATSNEMYKT